MPSCYRYCCCSLSPSRQAQERLVLLHFNLPPLFKPLFNFLEGVGCIYQHNFMRNGSGKMLIYHLLCLTGTEFPKLSTTTDPRTDWCGYPQSTTVPLGNIYGVIDLQLHCTRSRAVHLILEIKLSGLGLWQLMAALYRCEASTQKGCHPMGLLITTNNLIFLRWLEGEGRYIKQKFNVTNLVEVLTCVEVIALECEKYRVAWNFTPAGTDLAESMQVLQLEPSSPSLRQEMTTIRQELQSLVGRVAALEYAVTPQDLLTHGY